MNHNQRILLEYLIDYNTENSMLTISDVFELYDLKLEEAYFKLTNKQIDEVLICYLRKRLRGDIK